MLPASGELPIGTEGRFAIRLRDQTVAMRGRCRVTGARPAPGVSGGGGPRPTLLRVLLLEMEEESASLHRQLLARRRAAVPVPVPPAVSEPTIVSPPRPEVTAPPPFRVPPRPPVSGHAATMIGISPTRQAGASSPAQTPARPFVETRVSPPAEMRTPGAAFTLPANPLSELDATDLASFIDSTLMESDDEDATAEREAGPPRGDDQTLEQLAPPRAPEMAVEPTAPTTIDSPPLRARSRAGRGTAAGTGERSDRVRAIVRRAAPYLLCTIVGLGIGRLVTHSTPKAVPPVSPTAQVPTAQVPSVVEPPPTPAQKAVVPTTPAAVEQAAPPVPERPTAAAEVPAMKTVVAHRDAPAGRPSAAADGCSARVVTQPRNAKVSWANQTLGKTPLANAKIPCGAGVLTIAHERYQTVTREVTANSGTSVALSERLHRPPATLIVGSSPPGAAISVNGQPLGAAPRRLPTSRYEHVSIRATLAGYTPWTKKVYLSEATTNVTAQLTSTGRRR
jgi:hypothetical protein